jgi:hypothetical protein
MAVIQTPSGSLTQRLDRHVAAVTRRLDRHAVALWRTPEGPLWHQTLVPELLGMSRRLLGAFLLLVGGAMTITLWLLPVGMTLTLLGVALMAAPGEPRHR